MIERIVNWILGDPSKVHREQDHVSGDVLDEAYVAMILEHLEQGRWDNDISDQVSGHLGICCTPKDLRPYYTLASKAFIVGGDMGVCMAKFKGLVAIMFKINHDYGGPSRRELSIQK